MEGGFLADCADTADPVFVDGLIVAPGLLFLGRLFRYGGARTSPGGARRGGDGMMATDAGGGGRDGYGRGGDVVGHGGQVFSGRGRKVENKTFAPLARHMTAVLTAHARRLIGAQTSIWMIYLQELGIKVRKWRYYGTCARK